MRALLFAVMMLVTTPAFALVEYKAEDGGTYYRVQFAPEFGIALTAGIPCCSDNIEYNRISPPTVKNARHLHITADMDQTPFSLHSYEKIVKAEYLPVGSIYISGEGPTIHLDTIQTREAWKALPISKDGQNVSLEGLDNEKNVSLPAIQTEQIVAATDSVLKKELDNNNAEFWLGLAKECRVENGALTGACSLYVRSVTVKLTFEHEEPVLFTIDYSVGC